MGRCTAAKRSGNGNRSKRMTKIVINGNIGGFKLSDKAAHFMKKRGRPVTSDEMRGDLPRDDKTLVEVVEDFQEEASAPGSCIYAVEIPDDVDDWYIVEHDGCETIHEGRCWG